VQVDVGGMSRIVPSPVPTIDNVNVPLGFVHVAVNKNVSVAPAGAVFLMVMYPGAGRFVTVIVLV
jgi:hypothetical protein